MKTYCTYEQAVTFGGCRPEDIVELGYEMNQEQFKVFVESLIKVATQIINKYCNRKTFEVTTYTDEMHTLDIGDTFTPIYGMVRGFPGLTYSVNLYDYTTDLSKFTIIPREQPVQSVDKVDANMAWSNATPVWETLNQWSTTAEGDYKVIERYETTKIQFMKRFPAPSSNNIKITYKAGYKDDDPVWDVLALACSMIVANLIKKKKKNDEAFTIRGSGISSYERFYTTAVLTDEVKLMLDYYVKDPMAAFGYG